MGQLRDTTEGRGGSERQRTSSSSLVAFLAALSVSKSKVQQSMVSACPGGIGTRGRRLDRRREVVGLRSEREERGGDSLERLELST